MKPTRRTLLAALVAFPLTRLVGKGPEVEGESSNGYVSRWKGPPIETVRGPDGEVIFHRGDAPQEPRFTDWLNRQSKSIQDAVLGVPAALRFRSGQPLDFLS